MNKRNLVNSYMELIATIICVIIAELIIVGCFVMSVLCKDYVIVVFMGVMMLASIPVIRELNEEYDEIKEMELDF